MVALAAVALLVGVTVHWPPKDHELRQRARTVAAPQEKLVDPIPEDTVPSKVSKEAKARFGAADKLPLDPWTAKLKNAYAADPADIDPQILDDFKTWMETPDRDAMAGVELAKRRRVSLNALARMKPQKAWGYFVPITERTGLPPEVVALLAQPMDSIGDWQPYAVCMDPNLTSSTYYEATLEGSAQPEYALPVGKLVDAGNPKKIPLSGYRLDGRTARTRPIDLRDSESA